MLKEVVFLALLHLSVAPHGDHGGNSGHVDHTPHPTHVDNTPHPTHVDHTPHPTNVHHPTHVDTPKPSSTVNIINEMNNLYETYTKPMCNSILGFDCTIHIYNDGKVCGSDDITYNHCEFAKARCKDPTLKVLREDVCPIPTTQPPAHLPTTPSDITTTTSRSSTWGHDPGLDLIKDVFCKNLNSVHCGTVTDADICATDGKVYKNECLYAKVKCFEPNIEVTDPSFCGEHGLPIHSTPQPQIPLLG